MRTFLRLTAIVSAYLLTVGVTKPAQQPKPSNAGNSSPAVSSTQKDIEAYLRNLYALGPAVKVTAGPLKQSPVEGVLEADIDVVIEGNKQTVKFYVSKDGRYLLRGELSDMTRDPLAENLAAIHMSDAPTLGDPKSPVTIVEYSDFECPVCRTLHDALRGLLPSYAGKVRVIFKDFPLEQLHPWARTAALAGRCSFQQKPNAFWRMYDLIYDNQEIISASNAWVKMTDYASQTGLDVAAFKTCMASPEAAAAINASRANGEELEVNSTPTVFVNGRRLVGADSHLIQQYIDYELAKTNASKAAEKK